MKPISDDREDTQDVQALSKVSPARLQRLGNIVTNHLGAAGVDIEIETREDGRIAVVMPPELASTFIQF